MSKTSFKILTISTKVSSIQGEKSIDEPGFNYQQKKTWFAVFSYTFDFRSNSSLARNLALVVLTPVAGKLIHSAVHKLKFMYFVIYNFLCTLICHVAIK